MVLQAGEDDLLARNGLNPDSRHSCHQSCTHLSTNECAFVGLNGQSFQFYRQMETFDSSGTGSCPLRLLKFIGVLTLTLNAWTVLSSSSTLHTTCVCCLSRSSSVARTL